MLSAMKLQILLSVLLLAAGAARAELGNPKDIPEAGRIRVDGRLEDWRKAEWAPLEATYAGDPSNISNAQWALCWDEDARLYIAVRYDDADIVLQDGYVSSNAQDCVEIYVRGDTGSEPVDYSEHQKSAQHYIFGLSKNKTAAWKKLAGTAQFPRHNPATVAVKLDGRTFTYEIMVPLYDKFDTAVGRHSQETEVEPELEIGIDIVIVDAGAKGFAGMKSENTMDGKWNNADHIAEHRLGN